MAKIRVLENIHEGKKYHHTQYFYYCEGCGYEHCFGLKNEGGNHNFNMDLDNPTVSPSLLEKNDPKRVCHSYINNGKIQYLGDCHHELKNKTIDLPQIK